MNLLNNFETETVSGGWHPYLTHHGDNLPGGMTPELALIFFLTTNGQLPPQGGN